MPSETPALDSPLLQDHLKPLKSKESFRSFLIRFARKECFLGVVFLGF